MDATVPLVGGILILVVGLSCLAAARNMIKIIMGVEIMMNGAILALVGLSLRWPDMVIVDPLARAIAIMAIAIGGCLAAVALSIVIHAYRHYRTLDTRQLRRLRW